ncbi:immunity 22 family protein [Xanthomonas sp. GW]|uniref:immunity 22 family protein n=1 Tax=Xanthomonas sp. GW TaxID=2724121 RepID=UPI00163ACC69|nr:immunity 22 family protein [Xanthomonas sp. GW]
MPIVHVFVSSGRFATMEELRGYIDRTYTEDGDGVASPFMREIGLSRCEPACIEAVISASGIPEKLNELLSDASYWDQWRHEVDGSIVADAAICVFAPNQPNHPAGASVRHIGSFDYAA